jgi:hypothetical protein
VQQTPQAPTWVTRVNPAQVNLHQTRREIVEKSSDIVPLGALFYFFPLQWITLSDPFPGALDLGTSASFRKIAAGLGE